MKRYARRALLTALAASLCGCGEPVEPRLLVPVDQLAHEVHLEIGGTTLRLPLIALVWIDGSSWVNAPNGSAPATVYGPTPIPTAELIARRSSVSNPIGNVAYAGISVSDYSARKDTRADAWVPTTGLCPLLRQRWASTLCSESLIDGVHAFEPRSFMLVDEALLLRYRAQLKGSDADVADAIAQLQPIASDPEVHCRTADMPCIAVMRVDGDLLAVWWTGIGQTDRATLAKAGRAIRALIEHGMGEREQYDALVAELQR